MNALILAFGLAFALPGRAAPPPILKSSAAAEAQASGDVEALLKSSRARLDMEDGKGALADAEAAVAAGGGAAALAARADAKRALGRAPEEAISDYAQAARLDAQYQATYRRLLDQLTSGSGKKPGPKGAAGLPIGFVGIVSLAGIALLALALFVMLRHEANPLRAEEPPPEKPKP